MSKVNQQVAYSLFQSIVCGALASFPSKAQHRSTGPRSSSRVHVVRIRRQVKMDYELKAFAKALGVTVAWLLKDKQ
jgi:hypothetical protein